MALGMGLGLGPGQIVSDPSSPPQKRGRAPKFWAYVYCGQTAGWIKMTFGMEVGLGPGDIVTDGDSPQNRGTPPIFGQCPLWPNGWIDEDAKWYGSRPRPQATLC